MSSSAPVNTEGENRDGRLPGGAAPHVVPGYQDFLYLLVRGWRLLLVCLGLGAVAGGTVAYLATPIYRAQIVLAPVSDDAGGGLSAMLAEYGSLASLAGINIGSGTQDMRTESLATLRSEQFTTAFIRDQALMPELFADEWDAQAQTWIESDPERQPDRSDAFEVFDQDIRRIIEDRRTGLVTLSIDWRDPLKAADWANLLVLRLNEQMRARDVAEAQRSVDYLQSQLTKTELLEVRQGIYRLIETHVKTITLANARDQYAFRIIDPAFPPSRDRPVWPSLLELLLLGGGSGLFLGLLLLVVHALRAL